MRKKALTKRPSKKEIKNFAEFKDYTIKKEISIFEDGFMLGWNLAFERIPYKPRTEQEEKDRQYIHKLVDKIRKKKIKIEI